MEYLGVGSDNKHVIGREAISLEHVFGSMSRKGKT